MKIKWFFILVVCVLLWMITPVPAVSISDATIELSNDNSGLITIHYTLSDHEKEILSSDSEENLTLVKEVLGLDENGSGTYSFKENNMTQWAEMDGKKVLLLYGFYFDRFNWRNDKALVAEYPRIALFSPDFQPDLVTVIWPDGRELSVEKVTYIPFMHIFV